jgi:signal transduction histidine kinase
MRPLGAVMLAVVVLPVLNNEPKPSTHGTGAWVLAALVAYCASMLLALRVDAEHPSPAAELLLAAVAGVSAVALAGLQPHGAGDVAPATVVYTVVIRLPRAQGLTAAGVITVALAVTMAAATDASGASIAAATLLCVLLAAVADFMVRAGDSQDRTELLYAQLKDARDAQAEAAAIAERGRIAADLHDVLAHSLSGAAIQLQGARKLIERQGADPKIAAAVDRAAELVRDGLDDARRAVRALHGEEIPALDQLPALIDGFRHDREAPVAFTVTGHPRRLSADAGVALYRGAQEALTNIARYAPRASVDVLLSHDGAATTLTIEDHRPAIDPARAHDNGAAGEGLPGVGSGYGLAGMRDRIERVGGEMDAGATSDGWRVRLAVPA